MTAHCIEDGRFDWKVMLPPDDGGKERLIRGATAMANAGGGFLIFGVRDDGEPQQRIVGVPADKEFGASLARQLHRADPPVPHIVHNPPLTVSPTNVVYVVEILSSSSPHADISGRYFIRTGGGTDQQLKTHQLRGLFRSEDVREAPGLHEIGRIAFAFLRPRGWDQVRTGLEALEAYATEGTVRQKLALLEALTRLASATRQAMPNDVLLGMLCLCEEAAPPWHDADQDLLNEGFKLAADVAGHVGYDATLYLRHGVAVHTSARMLSDWLASVDRLQLEELRPVIVDEFRSCIDAAKRAQPGPFEDAVRWYEYMRDYPGARSPFPQADLDVVEARLLGLAT